MRLDNIYQACEGDLIAECTRCGTAQGPFETTIFRWGLVLDCICNGTRDFKLYEISRVGAESAAVRGGVSVASGGSAPGEVLMEPLPAALEQSLSQLAGSARFAKQFASGTLQRYVVGLSGEMLRNLSAAQRVAFVDKIADLVDVAKGGVRC